MHIRFLDGLGYVSITFCVLQKIPPWSIAAVSKGTWSKGSYSNGRMWDDFPKDASISGHWHGCTEVNALLRRHGLF